MRAHATWLRLLNLVLLVALVQIGCVRNPVTGQLQLALISEAQEVQLGREGAVEVERALGLVPDTALQSYIHALGTTMAAASERPGLPWRFGVVDDPTPNAFALPGGFIYFTRGMLALMNSEAELATVLGHEIAHVTARHQVTMITRAQLAQAGLGLGGLLFPEMEALGGVAGVGLSLLFLRYSRDMERQADDVGFGYALAQGFDVREMARVFASLSRLGGDQQTAVPAWLQTHPLPADRVAAVQARITAAEPLPAGLRVGRDGYLARLDGLVYGANPRNGFFRDSWYLHPDLAFQFGVPANWPRRNLAHAVMAASPREDGAVQLVLRSEADPDAAARAFLQQQGIQTLQSARQSINGLPAVVATFQAQTPQSTLQGLTAFIAYQNRVYQLMGYSLAAVYADYQSTFQQSVGSFGPLRDPAVLAVQPDRIRLVRIGESMTLAEFNRRFPSAIPLAELAVINAVAGPEALLPAGVLVKRVTGG